jgi:PBP1b-binding outer membrane lipoprotein LpoB
MFKRTLIMIMAAALLITGCAAKSPATSASGNRSEGFAPSAPLLDSQKAVEASGPTTNSGSFASTQPTDVERIVLKNADLSLYVDKPPESMDRISQMADEMGGFVVTANVYQTTLSSGAQVPHATITIRVPAEKLDEALARIKVETQQPLINETISSQDVTSDYINLEARLTNLEAAEKQLQSIMEKATKTEDVLSVFNQLTQVREQIETTKGQIQYYDQSAALSAITVDLVANAAAQPVSIGGWQLSDTVKQALRALQASLKFLAKAAIWTVILILPVLVVFFGPLVLVIWLIWRWWKNRKSKAAASSNPGA